MSKSLISTKLLSSESSLFSRRVTHGQKFHLSQYWLHWWGVNALWRCYMVLCLVLYQKCPWTPDNVICHLQVDPLLLPIDFLGSLHILFYVCGINVYAVMYTCTWEARGFFLSYTTLFSEIRSLTGPKVNWFKWIDRPANFKDLPDIPSTAERWPMHTTILSSLCGSSCLHCKHFTYWAVSTAIFIYFFWK